MTFFFNWKITYWCDLSVVCKAKLPPAMGPTTHLVPTLHTLMSPWSLKWAMAGTLSPRQPGNTTKQDCFPPENPWWTLTSASLPELQVPGNYRSRLPEYRHRVSPGDISYHPHRWAANTPVWGADKIRMKWQCVLLSQSVWLKEEGGGVAGNQGGGSQGRKHRVLW